MKVAIIGSRRVGSEKYNFIKRKVDEILKDFCGRLGNVKITIISGGARGVDRLAERYAKEKGYGLEVYRPDYNNFGKVAPLRRNEKIAKESDLVIAFPNDKSRGTWHCVRKARQFGKVVFVIKI